MKIIQSKIDLNYKEGNGSTLLELFLEYYVTSQETANLFTELLSQQKFDFSIHKKLPGIVINNSYLSDLSDMIINNGINLDMAEIIDFDSIRDNNNSEDRLLIF